MPASVSHQCLVDRRIENPTKKRHATLDVELGSLLTELLSTIAVLAQLTTWPEPESEVTHLHITDTRGCGQATIESLPNVASPGLTPFSQSVEFVAGTPFGRVVAGFTDSTPLAFSR
jgi:hypothetical protein